jgi:hypothetical protein
MNLIVQEKERKARKTPDKKPVLGSLKEYIDLVNHTNASQQEQQ